MNENSNNSQVGSRYQTEGYITSIGEIPQGTFTASIIYICIRKKIWS